MKSSHTRIKIPLPRSEVELSFEGGKWRSRHFVHSEIAWEWRVSVLKRPKELFSPATRNKCTPLATRGSLTCAQVEEEEELVRIVGMRIES